MKGQSPSRALTVGLFLQAVEGDCDFQVLKQDGQFSVLFAKCDSSPGRDDDYYFYFYPAESEEGT